jgi:hypothetical protein
VSQDIEPESALPVIEGAVRSAVARVLRTADELSITPYAAAFREARDYLAEATRASDDLLSELVPT